MYKYIGNGYIPGIPARDLSDNDFSGLDKEQQATVQKSGLYEYIKDKKQVVKDITTKEHES